MRVLTLCLLLLTSCTNNNFVDSGLDATADAPSDHRSDLFTDVQSTDAEVADLPTQEVTSDTEAIVDVLVSLGPVQCTATTDCPGMSMCQRTFPGGACLSCGSIDDCPSGTTCEPPGVCIRDCSSDADCNLGTRCDANGKCQARLCPCPAPYTCNTALNPPRCARPSCGGGGECPNPLVCNSGLCVEP